MSPKHVLVTGGMGFIGSFIVDELLRQGHRVRVFDNLEPQVHTKGVVPDYASPDAEFVRGDVRDYDALKKAVDGIEVIFHKAAMVGMGQSQYEIKKYVDVNTGGTANLLDIIVNHANRVEKVIVAASQSSYGEGAYECPRHGHKRPGLRPADQLALGNWEPLCADCGEPLTAIPISEDAERISYAIYAQTKTDQEEMVLNVGRTYKVPSVALRYFNVYGPRQSLSNPYTGVAAIFLSRLKNDKAPVIYEDGRQSRDFVSVQDIVQANMLAMAKPDADYLALNVGSGSRQSISYIAETLSRVLGKEELKPEITGKYRAGDTRHCFADISLIRDRLGFAPQISFERGMGELVESSQNIEALDGFDKARAELEQRGLA